jgi:hypothetical protein
MSEEQQRVLADALEAHGYDEWYSAILHSALEETKDATTAVQVAEEVFRANPTDTSTPQDDDADALFAAPPGI